jgi:hypothetical protein
MGILEYFRSRASHKPGKSFVTYGVRMKSARGTAQVERLVSNYVGKLRSAKTKNEKNAVERNFMHEYMNIKSKENAELAEVEALQRQYKSLPRSSSVVRRPPRPGGPRFSAARNKLVSNLRAELKKLMNARNYYEREVGKTKAKLNAIVASRQRS